MPTGNKIDRTNDIGVSKEPLTRRATLVAGTRVAGGLTAVTTLFSGGAAATHRDDQFTTVSEFDATGAHLTNPCTGETLEFLSGIIQITTHFHVKPDHDFVAHATFNLKNASLIGLKHGNSYQMHFNQNATIVGNLDEDFPYRETFRGHAGITSRGSEEDHKIWILIVIVITPDGSATVESISEGEECIG